MHLFEVSACEFVLNDGGPHYRWDKVRVSAGSIESTTSYSGPLCRFGRCKNGWSDTTGCQHFVDMLVPCSVWSCVCRPPEVETSVHRATVCGTQSGKVAYISYITTYERQSRL